MTGHRTSPRPLRLFPPLARLHRQRSTLVLWALLTACGSPQQHAISPVNAAEEVAREVHDADPHTPASEQAPRRSPDETPSDETPSDESEN